MPVSDPNPLVIAVHSLPSHGMAGLKPAQMIVGSRLLPVPSLLLSGITSFPGVERLLVDLERMLHGTFELLGQRRRKAVLYVGYLGHPDQVEVIISCLERFHQLIEGVVVDPVCGDRGRLYVPESVAESWPALLEKATWALPNRFELALHAGDPDLNPREAAQKFAERFPKLNFICTSFAEGADSLQLYFRDELEKLTFEHRRVDAHFGGTGDVFAAWFVKAHYIDGLPAREAAIRAGEETLRILDLSLLGEGSPLLKLERLA